MRIQKPAFLGSNAENQLEVKKPVNPLFMILKKDSVFLYFYKLTTNLVFILRAISYVRSEHSRAVTGVASGGHLPSEEFTICHSSKMLSVWSRMRMQGSGKKKLEVFWFSPWTDREKETEAYSSNEMILVLSQWWGIFYFINFALMQSRATLEGRHKFERNFQQNSSVIPPFQK